MTKAVLLLNRQGHAAMPAILCAEHADEAEARGIPLFATVFRELTAGMELRPNGDDYDLLDKGTLVGTLEVFSPQLRDGAG